MPRLSTQAILRNFTDTVGFGPRVGLQKSFTRPQSKHFHRKRATDVGAASRKDIQGQNDLKGHPYTRPLTARNIKKRRQSPNLKGLVYCDFLHGTSTVDTQAMRQGSAHTFKSGLNRFQQNRFSQGLQPSTTACESYLGDSRITNITTRKPSTQKNQLMQSVWRKSEKSATIEASVN